MSTGKRLAKRSIIGTRVVAPREDGLFHSAVIHAVKSTKEEGLEAKYSVRFDDTRTVSVFLDSELIGPGFQSVGSVVLKSGQRVYLTFNGREVTGEVKHHDTEVDEVDVVICPPGHENGLDVRKRLEEVRLLESRKSARLMDQDTDFARLADMAGDRKRTSSHVIDVPSVHGSRKRRPSYSQEDGKEGDLMNECTAALVLMRLSCSPHSPSFSGVTWPEPASPSPSLTDSWRSNTPSPPLSEGGYAPSCVDEGFIDEEFEDIPKKKKANRIVFQCTWPGCLVITTTCAAIETHVRATHLGPKDRDEGSEMEDDHEEEFYYTEVELGLHTSSPPTLSHRDMARPPHEDPEYQRSLSQHNYASSRAINIPHHSSHWTMSAATSPNSPQKHMKLCVSAPSGKLPGSPTRKVRGETKKCRKVYGMEHRELWCTQCKWKKACSRFGD